MLTVATDRALFQAWAPSSVPLQLSADPGAQSATPPVALSAETPDPLPTFRLILGGSLPATLQ